MEETMSQLEQYEIEKVKGRDAAVAAFVEANPGYAVDAVQPEDRGGTHLVTFGTFRGEPVVFKYYHGDPRKHHEKRALELFAPTGFVPRVYPDDTDDILVMERLRGKTVFDAAESLSQAEFSELHRQIGGAVAKVVEVMLSLINI